MLKVDIKPGRYVVAVSGGVDSMVLLDVLRKRTDVELVVAHYDHGIRPDSSEDRLLVQARAAELRLPFEFQEGHLGRGVSEATARTARYAFLERVRRSTGTKAIITAHHQDDLLETAMINLLRGTNRRGLSSLKSTATILRPLLSYTKTDLLDYAGSHGLAWREDSTNQDESYLRNYVRHRLITKLNPENRAKLLQIIEQVTVTNMELDALLEAELERLRVPEGLSRQVFVALNHVMAREIMALWLRQTGVREYDKPTLERLVVAGKTGRPGNVYDVRRGVRLCIGSGYLALDNYQR